MNNVLVTGGCGYIGSHTIIALLEKGYCVYIIDSHQNSKAKVMKKIYDLLLLVDSKLLKNINFIKGELRNSDDLERVFIYAKEKNQDINAVFHIAGLKSINESVKDPIKYWDFNLVGTLNLLKTMKKYSCKNLIYSSSASIYENLKNQKITEDFLIKPINPYSKTKAYIESLLYDVFKSEKGHWRIINLRYFNPIGAHHSGFLGEDPVGIPNNIFPLILKVASKEMEELNIFGNNWNTRDGTCIRDYLHIMDLAEGHIAAYEYLRKSESIILNLNIGTGIGTSVLELIKTFNKVNNIEIPFSFKPRREGDLEYLVADNSRILFTLDWKPKRNLNDMCKDGWNWINLNPNGYED